MIRVVVSLLATIVLFAPTHTSAAGPVAKCQSTKVKTMGKYVACRTKTEAKAAIKGEPVDTDALAKCAAKFVSGWDKAELKGDGLCADPPGSDEQLADATSALYADWAAGYVAGGEADICAGTCDQCNTDLQTCEGDLATCQSSEATCQGDLTTCQGVLGTCQSSEATCQGELTTCNGDLSTCNTDLGTAQGELTTCNTDLGTAQGDLTTCDGNLTTCTGDLSTCQGDLLACQSQPAGGFPATGQTTAFGPASDGAVQAGAALSYTDNGDGTITDNNTGLMWEKKDDSGGIHDKDNRYGWSTGTNNMDGDITTIFLATLNAGSGFAGHTDWRIPNGKELHSIVNLEVRNPTIDPAFHQAATCTGCTDVTLGACSCTASLNYWSSTSVASDPLNAWVVHFDFGEVRRELTPFSFRVRAVRGGL